MDATIWLGKDFYETFIPNIGGVVGDTDALILADGGGNQITIFGAPSAISEIRGNRDWSDGLLAPLTEAERAGQAALRYRRWSDTNEERRGPFAGRRKIWREAPSDRRDNPYCNCGRRADDELPEL